MTFESMSNDDGTTEPPGPHPPDSSPKRTTEKAATKNQISSSEVVLRASVDAADQSVASGSTTTTTPLTQSSPPSPTMEPDQNLNTFLLNAQEDCATACSAGLSRTTLDDEIRSRLDKLNALSDLINSLEGQFNEANSLFRETLKCSTERLSSLARTIGSKSIRQGRIYNAVKVSVEHSQNACQRACVRFEKANQDHQIAKNAIREAEDKLKLVTQGNCTENSSMIQVPTLEPFDTLDFSSKLTLSDEQHRASPKPDHCDNVIVKTQSTSTKPLTDANELHEREHQSSEPEKHKQTSSTTPYIEDAAKCSEDLNQALMRLFDAEKERRLSEREHMDEANKLMLAQEELTRMERDHGLTIRRTQYYFDESRRFNAKLNSVKRDICQISDDILAAKQSYARTLRELEQFSDDLHCNAKSLKIQ